MKLDGGSRCLRLFRRLSKNPTAVYGIINDLTHGRSVRVYVHAIASAQMTENSFRCYFRGDPNQFRITSRLNMIDPKNPLIQRQMSIKSHDYFFPSKPPVRSILIANLRCLSCAPGCRSLAIWNNFAPGRVALPISHDFGGAAKREIIVDECLDC
jgi:hypothetical protein